jgi:hypothetical protein
VEDILKQSLMAICGALLLVIAGYASAQAPSLQGQSCENAVPVENAAEQNDWIRQNLPGATIQEKTLINCSNALVGVVTVTQRGGTTRLVYFNMEKAFLNYINGPEKPSPKASTMKTSSQDTLKPMKTSATIEVNGPEIIVHTRYENTTDKPILIAEGVWGILRGRPGVLDATENEFVVYEKKPIVSSNSTDSLFPITRPGSAATSRPWRLARLRWCPLESALIIYL